MISLSDFLIVAAILFGIGIAGIIVNRKNIIVLLMSIELMLLAVNTNFIAFSHFLQNNAGQVFVFFYFDCRSCGSRYWFGDYRGAIP